MTGRAPPPPTEGTRHSGLRPRRARTVARACTEGGGSHCGAASAANSFRIKTTLQLSETCRLHLLEVVAGAIARASSRRCGDEQETLRAGDRGIGVEGLGRDELLDLGVPRGRLKV